MKNVKPLVHRLTYVAHYTDSNTCIVDMLHTYLLLDIFIQTSKACSDYACRRNSGPTHESKRRVTTQLRKPKLMPQGTVSDFMSANCNIYTQQKQLS